MAIFALACIGLTWLPPHARSPALKRACPRASTLGAPSIDAVADAKRALMRIAALTNRGQTATAAELWNARARYAELERAGGQAPIEGSWELLLSDVPLFRASPFFMALGKALDDFRPGAAERNLLAHQLATSVGQIGRVCWRVGDGTLVSEVELKVGLLPGLPVQLSGTVRTEAALGPSVPGAQLTASVRSTSVLGSALSLAAPDFSNGGQTSGMTLGQEVLERLVSSVQFPSGALLGEQQVRLSPLCVDEELMLVRCEEIDGHAGFAFLRTADSGARVP
jgi:hypothetical protein